MNYLRSIEALCKASLKNPIEPIMSRIDHLRAALKEEGDEERAQALNAILATTQNSINMEPFRLIKLFRSFTNNENSNV